MDKAVILTGGYLNTVNAKTAHGLIRGTDRFNIVGVIDHACAGNDAGEVLDGKKRGIPVFKTMEEFISTGIKAKFCIIGVATKGGVIPDSLKSIIEDAIKNKLSIVNGLHDLLSEHSDLLALANQNAVELIDIRRPKKFSELHFWSGKIKEVQCPKVAVLGTDCALGKRTTTKMITDELKKVGYKAEMIFTGQTGWMQGAKYGFIFDATLNDFISGEMEHAIFDCYVNEKPDIILIEGQSSLRNPSGPAGSEWIISADASYVIVQHHPTRKQYQDMEYYPAFLPSIDSEIDLIKMIGAKTIGVSLNTKGVSDDEAVRIAEEYESRLKIPVAIPLIDGVKKFIPILEEIIKKSSKK